MLAMLPRLFKFYLSPSRQEDFIDFFFATLADNRSCVKPPWMAGMQILQEQKSALHST
jgi:hypothetical protein